MQITSVLARWTPRVLWVVLASGLPALAAAQTLTEAVADGTPMIDLRYRYEAVSEDNGKDDARASTLRSRLGYRTAVWTGFAAALEFENVTGVIAEDYDSGTNGKTRFSSVPDPELTEVNQAYLDFTAVPDTRLRYGRQRIVLDNARFVGNVGWRQNEQTFDALALTNASLPDIELTYAYVGNVNTVTGGDIDTRTQLFHLTYSGLALGTVTAYGYLLDTVASTADSQTLGLRFAGLAGISGGARLLYTAEFARQGAFADAPQIVDADYLLLELGVAYTGGFSVRLGAETLRGDGTYAFQTPLATKHAFNGWADQFLVTPVNGLRDTSVTVDGNLAGTRLTVVYHDFAAGNGTRNYGTEVDAQAVKPFGPHYALGAAYAGYNAHTYSYNADKFWVWGETRF